MSTTTNRPIAALKLPTTPPALIKRAEVIAAAVTGNAHFPTPRPPLATLTADITAADAAETTAKTRAPGSATTRDDRCLVVVADLQQLRSYVQEVADATPASGAQIIESAGMFVRTVSRRTKPAFAVEQGAVSGSVKLAVKAAGRRASYEWQTSADQKTWSTLPTTVKAATTVSALTPGATVFFRYRVVTSAGEGDWSQILSFLVK